MKQSIKFLSSPSSVILLISVNFFTVIMCIVGIIGCITNPTNTILYLVLMCVPLVLSICAICIFPQMIYIVEFFGDKIKFRGLFHRYIIFNSQIQDIDCQPWYRRESYYFLVVEGYRYDPNKFKLSYPFRFICNRKTQELVQKLWVDIQSRRSDE